MAQFISNGTLYGDQAFLTLIAISPSFQAALTPWLLTTSSENRGRGFDLWEINVVATVSPTYQFTRSISLCIRHDNVTDLLLSPSSAISTPLFSHLQNLTLLVWIGRNDSFEKADELAAFVLKFRLLQTFNLDIGYQWFTSRAFVRELVYFTMILFDSSKFRNNARLLASLMRSLGNNLASVHFCFADLLKDQFLLRLQARMTDLCAISSTSSSKQQCGISDDRGTQCIASFLFALTSGYRQSQDFTDLDEVAPTFELIETIILNKDIFHPSFGDISETTNPHKRKYSLAQNIVNFFSTVTRFGDSKRVRFQLVRRYGTLVLKELFDQVIEHDDGSNEAAETFALLCDGLRDVIPDSKWVLDVEDTAASNSSDDDDVDYIELSKSEFQKMITSGRKCLAHFPFENMAYLLRRSWRFLPVYPAYVAKAIEQVSAYVERVQGEKRTENEAAVADVAARVNEHKILFLLMKFNLEFFKSCCADGRRPSKEEYPLEGIITLNALFTGNNGVYSTMFLGFFENNDSDEEEEKVEKQRGDDDEPPKIFDSFTQKLRGNFFSDYDNLQYALEFCCFVETHFHALITQNEQIKNLEETRHRALRCFDDTVDDNMKDDLGRGVFLKMMVRFSGIINDELLMKADNFTRRRSRDSSENFEQSNLRHVLIVEKFAKVQIKLKQARRHQKRLRKYYDDESNFIIE